MYKLTDIRKSYREGTRGRSEAMGEMTRAFGVTGESWFDHEWSTSMLQEDQTGWDWFSLQLSDETEVMIYRIRSRDAEGGVDSGSYIHTDDHVEALTGGDFLVRVTDSWRSPSTDIVYPAGWEVSLPSKGLELNIRPAMHDQEIAGRLRYWEGAVRVSGTREGESISGRGYVELTGYEEH